MTPFEKHQEMERVSNELRDFTKPSLAAIYGVISKNEGELIGSGTFLRMKRMSYLLTAAHVANKSREYPMRAHSTSFGGHPAPILHPFRYLPPPLDLAVVPIDKVTIENSEVKPLNVELFDASGAISSNEFLFIHGYPCHRSKPLPIEGGGVLAKSMYFHTPDGRTDWPFFNLQDHIAIEYPNFGWQEEGRPIPRPEAFCLSGSGVWRTNRANFSKEQWSPDKARMIGVNTVWTPCTESLVATRIEVVRSFLLDVVKQDVAYLRWEGRGKTLWDDWDDWFEGADKVTELTSE